mgnify:CR=1 FL=1
MRILVKLLAAPVVLVLMLFVWVCSALLYCSAFVFGLAGTIIGLLGLAVLVTYSVKNGIILLVIALLVSPMGLPMAAAWLLGKVQDSGPGLWMTISFGCGILPSAAIEKGTVTGMGASNKICPSCGRKMKQQFIGLQHCKCGMSWKKDIGFFERTGDMVFALERQTVGKKVKQVPVIRRKN